MQKTSEGKLSTCWTSPLATNCADGVSPTKLNEYLALLKDIHKKKDVPDDNVYSMDKTACSLGCGGKEQVITQKGTKTQHSQQGGNKENVTLFATICADGPLLHPTAVYKGKNIMSTWTETNPLEAE
jgi:hypothetical protein